MDLKITPSGQTIVKPTALGPVANTDTKLLIYGLFQKGRVLAQDGVVPTAQFNAATWVPGTPAHSWQAVASGGTSIGTKGMLVAAKTLALTAVNLFLDPSHVEKAKEELDAARGPEFAYVPLVGDRKPPLDYRK